MNAPAEATRATGAAAARWGLVWTLVRTDFKTRYHGTIGGFAWALLKPMCMFLVLMAVFSFLFASDRDYRLKLIVGLFIWDFFAEGTKVGLTSLHARGYLLTRARVPLWILVVTSISNPLLTLGVFGAVVMTFLTAAGRPPALWAIATFVAYGFALAAVVIGFSLASSVLFLRYRDLNQVWEVATQAGFFLAPVIYPLGILPERYHIYLYAWPPTSVIEFSRAVLVGGTAPSAQGHLLLASGAALSIITGAFMFKALSPNAAEYL